MTSFRISVVNEEFSVVNVDDWPDAETARKEAIRGALAIAVDHVTSGKPYFGAEVTLQNGDEKPQRFVVSVGASPLKH